MPFRERFPDLALRLRSLGIVRVLRHRAYAAYISTSWLATNGHWLQRIGIGWLTWQLTESGAWLGAVALGNSVPAILLTPFAGAVADRIDRLAMLRVAFGCHIVVSAALAALTLAGLVDIWLLLAFSILLGTLEAAQTPSRMTVAPGLVPREDLAGAIAMNSVSFNSSTFVGPAVGGLIISSFGIGANFVLTALIFLPNLFVLFRLTLREREHVPGTGQSLVRDIVEAVRYLALHRGIGPVILLAFVGSISVRHLPELMPGFAGAVFGGGADALGTLVSAFGLGGMLGSFWIANRNRVTGATGIFLFGLIGNGALVFLFAVSGDFAVALVTVALFGATMSTSGNSSQILIQNAVSGAMRARAMSLYSLTFRGGPALGAMLFGALSTSFGLQLPVAAGAAVCCLAGLAMLPRRRAIEAQLEAA